MAHIDALIDKVSDPALRQMLREQIDVMLDKQSFGLVYQQHKPETVELWHYKVKRGCKVRIIGEDDGQLYKVKKVGGGKATIEALNEAADRWEVDLAEIVVVREFGEAIYPGLRAVGSVRRSDTKAPHVVINAENFHALETLLYTHENTVDAIYIDPPYNSGARDWKYNNDYVDQLDQYRHSKWLAFMERRLILAKRLLKSDGVLVVTIDENEVYHLGMLLEELYPEAFRQMVTIVINPKGSTRPGLVRFSRVEEYAFFCFMGDAQVTGRADDLLTPGIFEDDPATSIGQRPRWKGLLRSGSEARRQDREDMFYPVLIDPKRMAVVGAGEPVYGGEPDPEAKINGYAAAWPIRKDMTWGRWGVGLATLRTLISQGFVSVGAYDVKRKTWPLSYLSEEPRSQLAAGVLRIDSRDETKNVVDVIYAEESARRIKTVWHRTRHDAGTGGSDMLTTLLGVGRRFDFPKSVYAVRDTLAAVVRDRPDAVIVDFFAGSGTTLHATAMLNAEDGGNRRTVLVTNNEVSVAEAEELTRAGYKPGDPEWERLGIFHYVTRPRVEAALTGARADGESLSGTYLTGGPLAAGFEENVEFFDLTYEDADLVGLKRKFEAIAPLLWMKAGGRGNIIDKPVATWTVPDDANYGVLFDTDQWREFADAIMARGAGVQAAFIVTDSDSTFQQIFSELPTHVASTQLYSDYLRTFEINTKGRA